MHIKTMEGLVGAGTNMNLLDTPMRVFKEARRRGDTATMERAMGYAGEFAGKAQEYKTKAEEGMKEEAENLREKEKLEREKIIEKHREEQEKMETGTEENVKSQVGSAAEAGTTSANKEPVIYTKTGSTDQTEPGGNISISV